MKNKKKALLFTASALAGLSIGLISQSQISAETVQFPYDRNFAYSYGAGFIEDTLGPITINGQWVWCIEPLIFTQPGYEYTVKDVISSDMSRHEVIVRMDPNGTTQTLSNPAKIVMAAFPYMALDMPLSDIQEMADDILVSNSAIEAHKIAAQKSGRLVETLRWLRAQPDYVRHSTVQMFYWQFVLGNFQSPRSIDRANSFAPYTGAPQHMIDEVNNALALRGAPQAALDLDPNEDWLMNSLHHLLHLFNAGLETSTLEYLGGSIYYQGVSTNTQGLPAQAFVSARAGRLRRKIQKSYISVNKSLVTFNGVNVRNDSFVGIKVGVYSDSAATRKVGELTIGAGGRSNVMEVQPDTLYYLYELDGAGQPIRTAETTVIQGQPYTGGKFVGQTDFGQTVLLTGGQTRTYYLENVPEVVNAKFAKRSESLLGSNVSPQFKIAGAEYTLYASRTDAQAGRNPLQTVRVGEDGVGMFTNLTRNTYYAKETKAPNVRTTSGNRATHALDPQIYELNLMTGGVRETQASTDATGVRHPVREFVFDGSFTSHEKVVPNDPRFLLRKTDREQGKAVTRGFATVAGAEYKIEFYQPKVLNDGTRGERYFTAVYKANDIGELDILDKSTIVQGSIETGVFSEEIINALYRQLDQNNNWIISDMSIREHAAPSGYHLSDEVYNIDAQLTGRDGSDLAQARVEKDLEDDVFKLTIVKRQKVENEWQTDQNLILPGTKFRLTNTSRQGDNSVELTVGNDGKVTFAGLGEGNYELREIEAPTGYQLNKQVITFTVGKNAQITAKSTSIETDDDGNYRIDWAQNRVSTHTQVKEDMDILMDNIPHRAKVKVVKVNEKGESLKGATFTLTRLDEAGRALQGVDPINVTTNDQGIAEFEGLVVGDYYTIEETKAPAGYKLPRDRQVIKFRAESIPIKDSFAVTYEFDMLDQYDATNRTSTKKAGKLTTAANSTSVTTNEKTVNGMSFTVNDQEQINIQFNQVNHTWKKLPATGSNTGLIAGSAVITLVFAGAAGVVYNRRKRS